MDINRHLIQKKKLATHTFTHPAASCVNLPRDEGRPVFLFLVFRRLFFFKKYQNVICVVARPLTEQLANTERSS